MKRIKRIVKRIKNRLKDMVFAWMFRLLLEHRQGDLLRAAKSIEPEVRMRRKCKKLLKKKLELAGEIKALTDDQLNEVKDSWKSIDELGLLRPEWVQIFSDKTGVFDSEYVGKDIHFYYVEPYFNDQDYVMSFGDKNYQDVLLRGIRHPEVLVRKIHGFYYDAEFRPISEDEAIHYLWNKRGEGAVIKISRLSTGGHGLSFVDEKSSHDDIRESLNVDPDVVVQSLVKQHPEMSRMNASSVNTLRIMTIMLDGEVIPLSTCARMGNPGSRVDNVSSGGFTCGVNQDGSLTEYGYNFKGDRVKTHPSGIPFNEFKIPFYEKALEFVKQGHYHVPVFGIISWDIAIDEEGEPVLIEYNVSFGGIRTHQYTSGPLYRDYKDKIIEKVFADYSVIGATLDYDYALRRDGAYITKGGQGMRALRIPSEIQGKSVKGIEERAFKGRKKLSKLIIPSSVETIGEEAFSNCPNLVIHCQKDSFAHKYAKENSLKFKLH